MIPITKNIEVIDENGNEYEATYPKRARGLVKSGRARFVDESTICLACPPKKFNCSEDNQMLNENIATSINDKINEIIQSNPGMIQEDIGELIRNMVNETLTSQTQPNQANGTDIDDVPRAELSSISLIDILTRIDKITDDNKYLYESIEAVRNMEPDNIYGAAEVGTTRAEAVVAVVRSRETTNQQIIRFLERIYGDFISPKNPQADNGKLAIMLDFLSRADPPAASEFIIEQIGAIVGEKA